MQISDEDLDEFIRLCDEQGHHFERGAALIRAKELLLLYEYMHMPLPLEPKEDDSLCPTCGKECTKRPLKRS